MARAQQYPQLILALVCLPVFIGALDLTIVSAVLPDVIRSLTVEIQKLDIAGWVVTGYFVSYAVSMTFMGKVSDIAGRRLVYLALPGDLLLSAHGSWRPRRAGPPASCCASWSCSRRRPDPAFAALYALIFGRVIQAFGAGAMVPVSMALVADLFPPEKRALPLGIVGAVDTAGWVLGPPVRRHHGPVHDLALPVLDQPSDRRRDVRHDVVGVAGLPRPHTKGGIDWIGVTLLAVALLLLNVGLGAPETDLEGSTAPPQNWLQWVAGAAVVFVVFLLSQRRIRDPILDLRIFSNRNLSAASGINLLVGFCIMVALVSVPIFINVAGGAETMKAALVTGYLLCAFTVPMALAAIPGGWLSERLGYRSTVCFGLDDRHRRLLVDESLASGDGGAGGCVLRQPAAGAGSVTGSRHRVHGGAGWRWRASGIGLTIAPIGTAVVNAVGDQERGMASSLVIILRLIGMSISMSSMTAYGLRRTTILEPGADRPGGRAGFGKDGQGGARRRDEDHERDRADFPGRRRRRPRRGLSASSGRRRSYPPAPFGLNRYPTHGSVSRYFGADGSGSSFLRSCPMNTRRYSGCSWRGDAPHRFEQRRVRQDAVRTPRHVDEQIELLRREADFVAVRVDAARVEIDAEVAELER